MTANPLSADALARHADFVRRLARSLVHDPGLAEDVAQETLVAAWRRPPREVGSARAWLARVARRTAGTLARGEARRREREGAAARPEGAGEAADAQREAVLRSVTNAVLELEEPYRTVVLLHHYEGLSHAEIAERTRAPLATVRSRLQRARAILRERLDRELGGREAWALALAPWTVRQAVGSATVPLAGAVLASGAVKVAAVVVLLAVAVWAVRLASTAGPAGESARTRPPQLAERDESSTTVPGVVLATSTPSAVGEREVVAPAPASPPPLEARVSGPDGAPAGAAVLALFDDGGLLASAETDADGRAELPGAEGAARLAARAPGFPLTVVEVDPGARRVEVLLPRGARVAGHVTDGGLPVAGLELALASDSAPLDRSPLPGDARLAALLGSAAIATATTREDGSFTFAGLPPSWRGELRLARAAERWILEASAGARAVEAMRLRLETPLEGLAVEAPAFRRVTGRVVLPGGAAPASGATLTVVAGYADGSTSALVAVDAGVDGRFQVVLDTTSERDAARWRLAGGPPSVDRIDAWLVSHPRGGGRALTWLGDEVPPALELGDLELAAVRSVELRVLDPDARPLAGAFARCGASTCGPSDAEGRLLLESLPLEPCTAELAAADHAVRWLEVPSAVDAPIEVTLEPCNRLEVLVRLEGGAVGRPSLRAASEVAPFALPGADGDSDAGWMPHGLHALAGAARASSASPGGWTAFRLTAAEQRVVLNQVTSAPITLRVVAQDHVLAELPPLVLGPTEHRAVELVVDGAPDELTGRVLDEAGRPLSGARVSLRSGRTLLGEDTTEASGSFVVPAYRPGSVDLSVEKAGFATGRLSDLEASAFPVDVTLERGHEVLVRIVDPDGAPVPAESVGSGSPTGDGSWRLVDLPGRTVVLRARVAGMAYEVEHDARLPEAVIRVPRHGALDVGLDDPGRFGGARCEVWVAVAGAEEPCLVGSFLPAAQGLEPLHYPVVLPGDYEVRVVGTEWSDGQPEERVFAGPHPVRVEAGRTTRVDL